MVNEETRTAPPPPLPQRRYAPYFGAVVLLMLGSVAGYFAYRGPSTIARPYLGDTEEQALQGLPPTGRALPDYRKWPRPDVAIVLSGQMHGYFDPCGCSYPQYGGLIRRFNFIDSLRTNAPKKMGWDVVGIDLGEIPPLQGMQDQNLLKYELSIQSLAAMNYRAVGIGKYELSFPLGEALASIYDKKRPYPRHIGTNLADTAPGKNYHSLNARPYEIIGDTQPKIGVISMIGPDLRLQHPKEEFLNNVEELPKALNAFAAAGVEVGVILHHSYPDVKDVPEGIAQAKAVLDRRRKAALMCAEFCDAQRKNNPRIPPIYLVMILTDEPEPPFQMYQLKENLPTHLVEIGHKGKYVGLVGVFREKKGLRLEYQAVQMTPDWETKSDKAATHPVIQLQERYHQRLKQENMLAKYPRTMHFNQIPDQGQAGLKSTYVGSERCADCHEHAYNVWKNTEKNQGPGHAKATATLENLKHPAGRQFDPECMMCHTVGFKHTGGYHNPPQGRTPEKHNKDLRGVGCESCHGPASAHVKAPTNKDIHKLINPYAPTPQERALEAAAKKQPLNPKEQLIHDQLFKTRMTALEQACTKCHDHENDVNWREDNAIVERWIRRGTIHRTPAPNAPAPPVKKGADEPAKLKIDSAIPEIKIEVLPEKK